MNKNTFEQIIQKITEQIKDLKDVENKGKYFTHEFWPINGKFYHLIDERTYEKGYRKPTPEELAKEKKILRKTIKNYPEFLIEEFTSKYSTENITVGAYPFRLERENSRADDFGQKYHRAKRYLEQFRYVLDAAKFQKENLDELVEKYEGTKEGKREILAFKKLEKCLEKEAYHTVEDELAVCAQCSPSTLGRELNRGFLFIENLIKYHIKQTKKEILEKHQIHSMKHSEKQTEHSTQPENNPFLEDLVLYIPNIENYELQFKTKLSYEIQGTTVTINKVDISQKEQVEDLHNLLEELNTARTTLKERYKAEIVRDVEKDLNEYKILVYTERFIQQNISIALHEEKEETQVVADISELLNQAKELKKKTAEKLAYIQQRIDSTGKMLKTKYNILSISMSEYYKPLRGWGSEDDIPGQIIFPDKKIERYANTELINEAVKYVKDLNR